MSDCLFCKVIAGQIPSKKVYEDDRVYAFEDIQPQAPTDAEILGYCQLTAAKIAHQRGIEDGYRTVFNVGPRAGQSVFHIHLHLVGGRDLKWPPG